LRTLRFARVDDSVQCLRDRGACKTADSGNQYLGDTLFFAFALGFIPGPRITNRLADITLRFPSWMLARCSLANWL
jgi:hypothetical protein